MPAPIILRAVTAVAAVLCLSINHVSAVPAASLGISASSCDPVMPLTDYPEGAVDTWNNWISILDEALQDEVNVKQYSACVGGSPAFSNFSLDAQGVLCSILNSGFNTVYSRAFSFPAFQHDFDSETKAINFIDQAGVGSCGYAGLAAMMVGAGPLDFFETVFDLYCFGEFRDSDDKPLPNDRQPREYLLKRDDTPAICDEDMLCMRGATYLFVTSVRDATNAHALSLRDKTLSYFKDLENISRLPPVEEWSDSFGSYDNDILFACSLLGLDCSQSAGACGDDEYCKTIEFNNGLFPPEHDDWQEYVEIINNALSNDQEIGPELIEGDGYLADLMRQSISKYDADEDEERQAFVNSLPIPVTELTKHCSSGAMLGLDANLLFDIKASPDDYYCGYGAWGCGMKIPQTTSANHFTYLQGCDKARHICYLWSWGDIYKVRCDILALITQSTISGKLADDFDVIQ